MQGKYYSSRNGYSAIIIPISVRNNDTMNNKYLSNLGQDMRSRLKANNGILINEKTRGVINVGSLDSNNL